MAMSTTRSGRPRSFDERDVIERALNVFWKHGSSDTTTRVLERELGITQSSIYNAFGSKQGLLDRALDRYLQQIDEEVVAPLDRPGAAGPELFDFVDRLMRWIGEPDRPGCLLLNMLGERSTKNPELVARSQAYRDRLRVAFAGALEPYGVDDAHMRAEVLLASVLGINISAYGGADAKEREALANGLRSQLAAWTAATT